MSNLQITLVIRPFSSSSWNILNCYYSNGQSIVNKLSDIHYMLYNCACDCAFISESWLHDGICDGLLDPECKFTVVRKDRVASKGGGVCAFIKRQHSILPVQISAKYDNLELIGIDFVALCPVLRVFLLYRPPHHDQNAVEYVQSLTDCLTEYGTSNGKLNFIVGDLNLPQINWNAMSCPDNAIYNSVLKFVTYYGYSQLVNFATRGANLLDVVLTDTETSVIKLNPEPPLGTSDHITIKFTVAAECAGKVKEADSTESLCQLQWSRADYQLMCDYLCNVNWSSIVCEYPSANHSWLAFTTILKQAIDLFVPTRCVRNTASRLCKPKHMPAVHKCANKKRRLWKKLRNAPHNLLLRSQYRDCVYQWRCLLRRSALLTESRIVDTNNLGAFYRFVNQRTKNRSGIGPILDNKGTLITSDLCKANAFNEFFVSVGTVDNDCIPHSTSVNLSSVLENIVISETEVVKSIDKLKTNSSCGPDRLPPVLFKCLKFCLCIPLTLMYNQLLSVGAVPDDWRTAHIVPVFKKGSSGDTSNYRPISLTCVPSKILERIVVNKILDHLYSNKIISRAQHGFVRRRSTCTNLLECHNDWSLCLQTRQQVSVVYIDFSKAFDVVSHDKLLAKLYCYGIRGSLLLWIKNFLNNRTCQTKVGASLSDVALVISGVVQGSGIGPLLFLVYINELAEVLARFGVTVKFFADDVKVYLQILNDTDVVQLQCAIDALMQWAAEWQLTVSINKCCVLNMGYMKYDTSISINGSLLPIVESVRDLGILVTHNLSSSMHVCDIVAKAHRRTAAIYRAFVSRNADVLVRAYTTYVRPLVENDSPVWSPYTIKDIDAIEAVQRRYTKRVPGLKNLSYPERLQRLNLISLELRRLHADLIWCYKILFGYVDMCSDEFFELSPLNITRGHKYKLYKKSSRINARCSFFAERVVNIWNSLPNSVDFSSVARFKRTVKKVNFSKFVKYT